MTCNHESTFFFVLRSQKNQRGIVAVILAKINVIQNRMKKKNRASPLIWQIPRSSVVVRDEAAGCDIYLVRLRTVLNFRGNYRIIVYRVYHITADDE